ncbi:hypothetical protein HGG70_07855, partial [Rhodobacteraceae bacterium R_SAG4]|nr:hypothetical protein [Rhodobacteraceae bacterium R_SAG4]
RIEFRLIESELPDAEDAEDEGDSGTDETAETAPAQAEPEEDTDGQ